MKNFIIYVLSGNNLEKYKLEDFFSLLENNIKQIKRYEKLNNGDIFYLGVFLFLFLLMLNYLFLKGNYTYEIIYIFIFIFIGKLIYFILSEKSKKYFIYILVIGLVISFCAIGGKIFLKYGFNKNEEIKTISNLNLKLDYNLKDTVNKVMQIYDQNLYLN